MHKSSQNFDPQQLQHQHPSRELQQFPVSLSVQAVDIFIARENSFYSVSSLILLLFIYFCAISSRHKFGFLSQLNGG